MFKIYWEVIDEMGKVSLSHVNRLSSENRDFSRWPAEEKHEKVSKLTSDKFPGLKNHFSWVSFFTLATMVILILLKSRLNNQK